MEQTDIELMALASERRLGSPISSRQIGVVVANSDGKVVASACNELFSELNLPQGIHVNDDIAKIFWVEHAERAAIYSAARSGIKLAGCSIYATLFPCSSCMRAIVQSGISTLVCPQPDLSLQKWSTEFRHSKLILENSPLKFRQFVASEITAPRALG
ncbi:MAG: deaminase [Rhizobiaceae bacterium]|nr:deaminase [Rhizobiaceae bacterium]